jgi:hypothetical protein
VKADIDGKIISFKITKTETKQKDQLLRINITFKSINNNQHQQQHSKTITPPTTTSSRNNTINSNSVSHQQQ